LELIRKKTISGNIFHLEGVTINQIELREYRINSNDGKESYAIMLYINTDHGEKEVNYLGKLTKDREEFNDSFNFLCNYNGILSSLNRIIIEIEK
jgi:hypothetical protein